MLVIGTGSWGVSSEVGTYSEFFSLIDKSDRIIHSKSFYCLIHSLKSFVLINQLKQPRGIIVAVT